MAKQPLERLQYVVLPTKLRPGSPSAALHNQTYKWWSDFWDDVYIGVGSDSRTSADLFRRHDFLSIVLDGSAVAAMCTGTYVNFELACDRDHGFFRNYFTPKANKAVDNLKVTDAMIMEYFSVAKNWQHRSHDISMGLVLLSLSQRFFLKTTCEAWFGVARADVGAAKICYEVGALTLDKGVVIRDAPCDIIAVTRSSAVNGGTLEERILINSLWEKRTVMSAQPREELSAKVA